MYGIKRVKDLNKANGTHRQGCIRATYAQLVTLFGKPVDSDNYKSSGDWILEFNGEIVTVYDWKLTSLYDERLPSVKDFRASKNTVTFMVGGHNLETATQFIESLSHELDSMQTIEKPKLSLVK